MFREKTAWREWLIGWTDKSREVKKTVIPLLLSKTSPSCLTLGWMLMKLVRETTESGERHKIYNLTSPKAVSTISIFWVYNLVSFFYSWIFCFFLPPKNGFDSEGIAASGQKATRASLGKETSRKTRHSPERSHGFTGRNWFCIHAASICTWTGRATGDTAEVGSAIQRDQNLPGVLFAGWTLFGTVPRRGTGRTAFTRPPWLTPIRLITRQTHIQSHLCHTCSGYSSKDQFAPKLCSSSSVCGLTPV